MKLSIPFGSADATLFTPETYHNVGLSKDSNVCRLSWISNHLDNGSIYYLQLVENRLRLTPVTRDMTQMKAQFSSTQISSNQRKDALTQATAPMIAIKDGKVRVLVEGALLYLGGLLEKASN